MTDLQVSPRRSPSSLGYTNTSDPRGSCVPSDKGDISSKMCGGIRNVGTQFMTLSVVAGEEERVPGLSHVRSLLIAQAIRGV